MVDWEKLDVLLLLREGLWYEGIGVLYVFVIFGVLVSVLIVVCVLICMCILVCKVCKFLYCVVCIDIMFMMLDNVLFCNELKICYVWVVY